MTANGDRPAPVLNDRKRRPWTSAEVPDQTGRVAVITGANGGLGREIATVLAGRGAHVVLACRDLDNAAATERFVAGRAPNPSLHSVRLDLADPASIREAAAEITGRVSRIDLLINNAGVLWPPFQVTDQGLELQFATNHVGHFHLSALLAPTVLGTAGSRFVIVGSLGHWLVRDLDLDDLGFARGYRPLEAYGRSKLANLLFCYALQRRLSTAGSQSLAVAAHPGGARTELIKGGVRGSRGSIRRRLWRLVTQPQNAAMGALPILRAATDPHVGGAEYFGPDGLLETRGHPKRARCSAKARDVDLQERLWERTVELAAIDFPL
jgi:NAD(P)-dependent dehydrogenase (short-subunit alcohol dehydrogenase family)